MGDGEGNLLCLTEVDDKIVYIENDWLGDTSFRQPLYTEFSFGETTLADIREYYSGIGFFYEANAVFRLEGYAHSAAAFQVDNNSGEIIVFITKLPLQRVVELYVEEDGYRTDEFVLDAIIIAKKEYLDAIWGETIGYEKAVKIKP